jgi:hypothetical protein
VAGDQARLDGLLRRALTAGGAVDRAAYAECRAGLLKPVSLEAKIPLPAAHRWQGGGPLSLAAKLRLDHGALAALRVPTPTPAILAAIRTVLAAHNAVEEGPGGVYDRCQQLARAEADALLAQLPAAPEVPVAPYADGPQVMRVVRRALPRAGYDIERRESSREAGPRPSIKERRTRSLRRGTRRSARDPERSCRGGARH